MKNTNHPSSKGTFFTSTPTPTRFIRGSRLSHLLVVGQSAGCLEHHPPADLDGVVGEAFVEAAQQCDVDRGTYTVLPFVVDQQREEVAVLGVDGIVLIAQAIGLVRIA